MSNAKAGVSYPDHLARQRIGELERMVANLQSQVKMLMNSVQP